MIVYTVGIYSNDNYNVMYVVCANKILMVTSKFTVIASHCMCILY